MLCHWVRGSKHFKGMQCSHLQVITEVLEKNSSRTFEPLKITALVIEGSSFTVLWFLTQFSSKYFLTLFPEDI